MSIDTHQKKFITKRTARVVYSALLVFVAVVQPAAARDGLRLNEFMTRNTKVLDEDGDSSDWIELYNSSSQPVNLGDYYLSDNQTELQKWRFPEYELGAGEYLIVYASDKNRILPPYFHTNFKLSNEDGIVVLSHAFQGTTDQVEFDPIPRNMSYGRHPETGEWRLFRQLTPGSQNTMPLTPVPEFSVPGGFYSTGQAVEIRAADPSDVIYYTLNGRTATTSSTRYTGPIPINSGIVTLRAVAKRPGFEVSPPAGQTYLINFDAKGLPVLVIASEDENLWDPARGIFPGWGDTPFVTPNLQRKQRRPIHLSYFTEDRELALAQDAQIQVVGASSRKEMMRPFKLSANEDVDPMHSHFEYPVMKKDIPSFRHLQIRNDNQDGAKRTNYNPYYQPTLIRNTLMAEVCRGLENFDLRDTKGHVLMIINGINYGLGDLGEKRDNSNIEENHPGVDNNDVDMIVLRDSRFEEVLLRQDLDVIMKDFFGYGLAEYEEISDSARETGGTKGIDDFLGLMRFMKERNLANAQNYAYVEQRLDLRSVATSFAAQMIAGNLDYINNNIGFWRSAPVGETPGPFRIINYDFDATFGLARYNENDNSLQFIYDNTFFLRSLLNNTDFRQAFIRKIDALLNGPFRSENTTRIVQEVHDRISPWVEFHFNQWSAGLIKKKDWQRNVQSLSNYLNDRPGKFRRFTEDFFNLPGSSRMTVTVTPPDGGAVYMVSDLAESLLPESGLYFNGLPLTVRAKPARGYRLASMVLNGEEVLQENYTFTPASQITLHAEFVQDDSAPVADIVINEIVNGGAQKRNDEDGQDSDWIELYNTTGYEISLSGKFLTDDPDDLRKWSFPNISIAPKDYLIIMASGKDRKDPDGQYLHTNFKLSSGGEPVLLIDSNGQDVIDELTTAQTSAIEKNHSGGRYPDGGVPFYSMAPSTPGYENVYEPPSEPAVLTSPAVNSTLNGSSVLFEWSSGSEVSQYQLNIGRDFNVYTMRESDDFLFSYSGDETQVTADNIPRDGNDIYARLWSYMDGAWVGSELLIFHTEYKEEEILSAQNEEPAFAEMHTSASSLQSVDAAVTQTEAPENDDDSKPAHSEPVSAMTSQNVSNETPDTADQDLSALDQEPSDAGVVPAGSLSDVSDIHAAAQAMAVRLAGLEDLEEDEHLHSAQPNRFSWNEISSLLIEEQPGAITHPQEDTVIAGTENRVEWHPAGEAQAYQLDISRSRDKLGERGRGELYSEQFDPRTTRTIIDLTTADTNSIYIRLWTLVNNEWLPGTIRSVHVTSSPDANSS
ncbi:MAG: lamin tail domain-containing protein [Candidatus Omnitrophota bacterium]